MLKVPATSFCRVSLIFSRSQHQHLNTWPGNGRGISHAPHVPLVPIAPICPHSTRRRYRATSNVGYLLTSIRQHSRNRSSTILHTILQMTLNRNDIMNIIIRKATAADALAIIETRLATTQSTEYPTSNNLSKMSKILAQQISIGQEIFIVATNHDDKILGYAAISLNAANLRALYVHPNFSRNGIGRLLLAQIEALALHSGVTTLDVDATLSAERFYTKNGFVVETSTIRIISPWYSTACVPMQKILLAKQHAA